MARLNPERIGQLSAEDTTFRVTLKRTPAPTLNAFAGREGGKLHTSTEHRLRVDYPPFFPTVPLELYLDKPVAHPNIHPESGFVCLWQKHRASNTIEHALHKTAAILGWKLKNDEPLHIMQPQTAAYAMRHAGEVAALLHTEALIGIDHASGDLAAACDGNRPARRRLS